MKVKPKSSQLINSGNLKNTYWLKTTLVDFCKGNGLTTTGSKHDLLHRIEVYLISGRKIKPAAITLMKRRDSDQPLTRNTLVVNYKNDAATTGSPR
jgi:hypothetical protein